MPVRAHGAHLLVTLNNLTVSWLLAATHATAALWSQLVCFMPSHAALAWSKQIRPAGRMPLLKPQANTSLMDQAAPNALSGIPARAHRAFHCQALQCRQQFNGVLGDGMFPELPAQWTGEGVNRGGDRLGVCSRSVAWTTGSIVEWPACC